MNTIWSRTVTSETLIKLGFTEFYSGTQDIDWRFETTNFKLYVDCYGEMKLVRKFPDSDFISLYCEDLSDVQMVLDWIAD